MLLIDLPKKRNKYKNIKIVLDDEKFDSIGEADRWIELVWLFKARKIANLKRQVRFKLKSNDVQVGVYVADFTYWEDGVFVIEDFKGLQKGVAWELFKLKFNILKTMYKRQIDSGEVKFLISNKKSYGKKL